MIESLHSPHIGRVKALLGTRGKKERRDSGVFVAEGLQFLREATQKNATPVLETLYLTRGGREKTETDGLDISNLDVFDVSDEVMSAMGETVTPQGILGLCRIPSSGIDAFQISDANHVLYLHEIQDPGNAGTILRTADATGFSACLTSSNSVDFYSPKVVRASAGSLWHIPLYEKVPLADLIATWPNENIFALDADGATSLLDIEVSAPSLWIFGNEAQGLNNLVLNPKIRAVNIPMAGNAESLNLASAAAIVMFRVSTAS
ncbi:MAG: RNA methyltransferase [Actinobacteria bacterium]|nr:RNA methyltransferase [Actinomycetota bacterium]